MRFDDALKFVYKWEGGYVNNAADPGGATNRGVTQRTYDDWRARNGLALRSVKDISVVESSEIYYKNYWLAARSNELPEPLCLVMFDTAVNFGVAGSVQILQEVLRLKVDGIFGSKTFEGVRTYAAKDIAKAMCAYRQYYRYRVAMRTPSQKIFLEGWLNRDRALMQFIN